MTATKIPVSFMDTGEHQFLTAYVGSEPLVAREDHINFAKLVQRLVPPAPGATLDEADEIRGLFSPATKVEKKFERLSERITFEHGEIKLDGDPADRNAPLVQQILRFVEEDVDDWQPLVKFFEKLLTNPNEHSQTQLYNWVRAQNVSITPDGDMICYKGVHAAPDGHGDDRFPASEYPYRASSSGFAIVDDKKFQGYTPNRVGAVVRMPRSNVHHDPASACSTGLHIGSFDYATGYASDGGAKLAVIVNPRDVVSVPNDGHGEKARVCRYVVAEIAEDAPYPTAIHSFEKPQEEPVEAPTEPVSVAAGTQPLPEEQPKPESWGDAGHDPAECEDDECRTTNDDAEQIAQDEPFGPAPTRRSPTEDEFHEMFARAKRRRRNFVKYATKHGPWNLITNDGSSRLDWEIND